jgi:simple sugar transport system permease protein
MTEPGPDRQAGSAPDGPQDGETTKVTTTPGGEAAPGAADGPGGQGETAGREPFGKNLDLSHRGKVILGSLLEGSSIMVTTLAIVLAIVVGGLLIAFTDPTVLQAWGSFFSNPGNAIAQAWDAAASAYSAMFEGAVFNPHTVAQVFSQASLATALHDGYISAVFNPISETCVRATPLILAGLAVALPFRAGLFNIGGQSQWIGGAMFATWLGFGVSLPPFIHCVVCVLGGFAGGAVIGWVPGVLKARTGAHEVIVTIMLNYAMAYLLSWLLGTSALGKPGTSDLVSPNIAGTAVLPHIAGPTLRLNAGFLIAIAAAVGVWWLLSRSTVGFEFRTVGANPSAARTAGMNVERSWILVLLLAGGLAGLGGAAVIQGTDHYLTFQSFATYGIDAITVALLGRARPLGVVLAALLYGGLYAGGVQMQAVTQTPASMTEVIQALIVLFVAAPAFVRAIFRLRGEKARGEGDTLSKGWGS